MLLNFSHSHTFYISIFFFYFNFFYFIIPTGHFFSKWRKITVALSIFLLTRQITYADEISTDYTVEWAAKEPERRHFAIQEIAWSAAHSPSLMIPELYYRIFAVQRF